MDDNYGTDTTEQTLRDGYYGTDTMEWIATTEQMTTTEQILQNR
jgi:hypothetical protein